MEISLNDLEQEIDGTILKRGLRYFENGNVADVNELADGEYEAIVEGTNRYTVSLTIEHDILKDYDCDCPYDMGPVCKHVVAVLLYLQENVLDPMSKPFADPPKANRTLPFKKKTINEDIDCILNALSQDELSRFVRDICAKDREFRLRFLTTYNSLIPNESPDVYANQVESLISLYSGMHGFIDYQETRDLCREIDEILENARESFKRREYRTTMQIALAVIKGLADIMNQVDDSGGYLGGCISESEEIIGLLVQAKIEEPLRKDLFNCLIKLYESKKLHGFDWHQSIMHFAITLSNTAKEQERIRNILSAVVSSSDSWVYEYENTQMLMLELIKKTGNKEDVISYLLENISNNNFREILIVDAINEGRYEEAAKLANEGILVNQKEDPELVTKWKDYLLDISIKTNDIENAIRLARFLLIHASGQYQPLNYYYIILKSHIPTNSWSDYLDSIVADLSKNKKLFNYDIIFQLYVLEEWWGKLLSLLQRNATLWRIEEAEKYLAKSYPKEFASLYQECILSFVDENLGRPSYKQACRYIRRMIKLGAKDMAEQLVQQLKQLYPKRRALLEELNMVQSFL